MKKFHLTIDTSRQGYTKVQLTAQGSHMEEVFESPGARAQMVLPLIEGLCKKNGIALTDIEHITVESKGSSLTGLRVGLAVATALGYLLGIPVNGKQAKLAQPGYNDEE